MKRMTENGLYSGEACCRCPRKGDFLFGIFVGIWIAFLGSLILQAVLK